MTNERSRSMGLGPLSPEEAAAELTGRYLLILSTFHPQTAKDVLLRTAGITNVAVPGDFDQNQIIPDQVASAEAIFFSEIGAAVVQAEPAQARRLSMASQEPDSSLVMAIEPERRVYSADCPPAVDLIWSLRDNPQYVRFLEQTNAAAWDESQASWGLKAISATDSQYSGRGVRVALLDTGVDESHPDLQGRVRWKKSFIPGENPNSAEDRDGHGTHCAGIICGQKTPRNFPRYGVACDAELGVSKVLDDDGEGIDGDIIAGMDWAAAIGCSIISMSISARVQIRDRFSPVYEVAASRLLDRGIVTVCAAGNDSSRAAGVVAPVGSPANCPSIVAVAALTKLLAVADFSNGAIGQGQIDISAPGVDILSSYLTSRKPEDPYLPGNGTSFATPHVAGVLALLAEAHPDTKGRRLVQHLKLGACELPFSPRDVGAGLVQAPS